MCTFMTGISSLYTHPHSIHAPAGLSRSTILKKSTPTRTPLPNSSKKGGSGFGIIVPLVIAVGGTAVYCRENDSVHQVVKKSSPEAYQVLVDNSVFVPQSTCCFTPRPPRPLLPSPRMMQPQSRLPPLLVLPLRPLWSSSWGTPAQLTVCSGRRCPHRCSL